MGQYYVFVNLAKYQIRFLGKALEFLDSRYWLPVPWLPLLLLDLGNRRQFSLQNRSLAFNNSHQLSPSARINQLPKAMQKKLDFVDFLSQHQVGEWAGDQLIITGDETDYSPYPPNWEWKKVDWSAADQKDEPINLYDLAKSSEQFSRSQADYFDYQWSEVHEETVFKKLREYCGSEFHYVVNLDKKEYLDPLKYNADEKNVLDMMHIKDYETAKKSVMVGLLIRIMHSTTRQFGDIHAGVISQAKWAGDRIVICTAAQLDDFESYTDVSDSNDVKVALLEDEVYDGCPPTCFRCIVKKICDKINNK